MLQRGLFKEGCGQKSVRDKATSGAEHPFELNEHILKSTAKRTKLESVCPKSNKQLAKTEDME